MATNPEKEPSATERTKKAPSENKSPDVTEVKTDTNNKIMKTVGKEIQPGEKETDRMEKKTTTEIAKTCPVPVTVVHPSAHYIEKEDVQNVMPESFSAGVNVGVSAAGVVLLIQSAATSLPHLGLTLAGAAGGAYLGNKLFPKSKAAPYLGGALGAVGTVPALSAAVSAIPSISISLPLPASLGGFLWSTVPGAAIGAYLGHRWFPKKKNSWLYGGLLGGSLSGYFLMPTAWVGTTINLASYAPVAALGVGQLAQIASLGLVAGAAGGALYGLGKIDGWMWGRSKTNSLWKNFGRGLISPLTIPAGLLYHSSRFGVSEVGKTLRATKEGIIRIFTGNSPAVRAVTSPVWWPIRSTYRFGRGMVKGLYNGLTNSQPSETDKAHGVFGKMGRALPYAAGRVIRSPLDMGRWLMSPGWSSRK